MSSRHRTADQVAELYGVSRATVYRWVETGLFDPAPETIASPSGTRDRILFDVDAVAKQFEAEMLAGPVPNDSGKIVARRNLERFRG